MTTTWGMSGGVFGIAILLAGCASEASEPDGGDEPTSMSEAPLGVTPPAEEAAVPLAVAPEVDAAPEMKAARASPCFDWSGQIDLAMALRRHACVSVAPGTYTVTSPIRVPAGKTLRGASNNRTAAVFVAGPGFDGSSIVTDDGTKGDIATIQRLTFDPKVRTNGIGARRLHLKNVEVKNAKCWGVAIVGTGFELENSNIHHNGSDPTCKAAPGGGVYIARSGGPPDSWKPIIHGNAIHDNTGPGLDIAGAWGGKLYDNDIRNNSHWAAVSVFASNWEIYNNRIFHPTRNRAGVPDGQPYWSMCRGGPNGTHTAAIMVCQQSDEQGSRSTGNYIHDNSVAAYYGVQLIGNDEVKPYWAPRNNRVLNNRFTGSVTACVDDFRPGQWGTDKNTWTSCTPQYF